MHTDALPLLKADEYPGGLWYYEPHTYQPYRYVLGPQRATDPNDMDRVPDRALCDENLRWLQAVLAQTEPTMWAAWGTLIEKRDYLPGLMREMVALTREKNIPWVTFGKRSKKGHPHHPLYLRKDSTPEPFDVENYLDTCF